MTLLAGKSGALPPRSGSSVSLVGQAMRFRYRSTSSASGERPIFPRATMCKSTIWRRLDAERPGERGLEPVVDRLGRLGDDARPVAAAARKDRNRDAMAIGHGQEADIVGEPVERAGLMLDRNAG